MQLKRMVRCMRCVSGIDDVKDSEFWVQEESTEETNLHMQQLGLAKRICGASNRKKTPSALAGKRGTGLQRYENRKEEVTRVSQCPAA